MSTSKPTYPCFVCKNNGFPSEMIILAGKDDRGSPIRKNPDETPHVHKNKLGPMGGRQYQPQQQTTIPMTQPLSGQQNHNRRDEEESARIIKMHEENVADRKAERELMAHDIDAKLEIARAITKLAEAIKEKGLAI